MSAARLYNQVTGEYEMSKKEKVLCFPAKCIEDFKCDTSTHTSIMTDAGMVAEYLKKTVYSGLACYVDREQAENDPEWKQIIPYTVFQRSPSEEVFMYERTKNGGESRLHSKKSIGVGGHINPCDGENMKYPGLAYWEAFYREIREEVNFICHGSPKTAAPIIGLIYDDSNDVGKVHFGVVHLFKVPAGTHFTSKDPAIANGEWVLSSDMEFHETQLENWSALVAEYLL